MSTSPEHDSALTHAEYTRRVRATSFWAFLGGALLLYFGVRLRGLTSNLDSPTYAQSLVLYVWSLRIGGAAMIVAGAACLTGRAIAVLFDAVVCAVTGVALVIVLVTWIANGDSDWLLTAIIAAMFLVAAAHSWRDFSRRPRGAITERAVPPVAPAARPRVRPSAAEPSEPAPAAEDEPPDGYLAALAREEERRRSS